MSREWKPGDVVIGKCIDLDCVDVEHPAIMGKSGEWWLLDIGEYSSEIRPARPLVVIDPEDWRQVDVLHHKIMLACASDLRSPAVTVADVRSGLLQYAADPPMLPPPADAAARVTDRRDNIWRLLADGDWVCTSGPDIGEYLAWDRLASERGPLEVQQ